MGHEEKGFVVLGFVKSNKTPDHATGRRIYINRTTNTYSWSPCKECEIFVEVIYDYLHLYTADRLNNVVIRDFAVIFPTQKRGFLISKDTKISFVEAQGYRVFSLVREGSNVKRGQKIAYVITRKHEVRTIKSPANGLIIYISSPPNEIPEKYIFVITGENNVSRIMEAVS